VKRIRHFLNTLQTNWSEDPAARGAAKMTAGAVLVAEGLFGVIRRGVSRVGGRRRKGKGGLLGGIIGVVIGIVFIVVGSAMGPTELPDEVSTQGVISDVETSRNDEGNTMYSPVYSFEVDGREYSFGSSMRSSSRPTIGQQVDIAYSASNPENARRTDGLESRIHWAFIGSGIFVLLMSLVSLAISIALIVFGIMLFRSGRADRKSAGETGSFLSDLMSIAQRASSGEIDIDRTAVGQAGSAQGDVDATATT
jgi:hypothetical protein